MLPRFSLSLFMLTNKNPSRPPVNHSQSGNQSRRRRPEVLGAPGTSGGPLHESASEAPSAKMRSASTAAHGLSATRRPSGVVFQFPQEASATPSRFLSIPFSTPIFPQRTGSAVTAPASSLRLPPTQQSRQPGKSLNLGAVAHHSMPSLLMFNTLSRWVIVAITAFLLSACASNDNPPCRRVSATEFMRPHTFKGIASDEFIGLSGAPPRFSRMKNEGKAFKKIWEFGLFHGWAVIWCPEEDLPKDYLLNARLKPNRKNSDDHFIHE